MLDRCFDLGDQLGLGFARIRPLRTRLEHEEGIGHRRRHRVGRDFGSTELAEYALHFRKLLDPRFQRGLHADCLIQAGAGNAQRMHGDVAFVQARDEFRTQPRGQQRAQRHTDQRASNHPGAPAQRPCQRGGIGPPRPLHQAGVLFLDLAAQEQGDGGWHKRQRKQHRPGERQHHRNRHRVEHFSFDAGERENGQVDRGDDAQAEQARPDDFIGCRGRGIQPLLIVQHPAELVLQLAEPAQAVLDDDHCTVDDQAEVERAQAHQVARYAATHHAEDREQHRQRDHRGGDQRGAEIAEQQEQHHDHQQCAFDKVLGNCPDRAINQRGAVIDRVGRHSRWQARVGLGELGGGGLGDLATVGTYEHEHRAQHDLATVLRRRAVTQLRTFADFRHVAHADRHAITAVEHDVADPVEVGDLAGGPHQELLSVAFDIAGTDVLVVGSHGCDDVMQGETQRDQFGRIRSDVDLPGEAADGVDLGNTGRIAQLRPHHPVLQGAQVSRRPRRAVLLAGLGLGIDRVHEDLAHAGGNGTHLRFQVGRQLRFHLLDTLGHLLPGEVQIGAVLEHHRDLRQPVARDRAGVVQARQAGQRGLDREGHALLGLQRRVTRELRVDLHLDVGNVRRGIDRQVGEAPHAQGNESQGERQHQPAVPDGEADDFPEHGGVLSGRGKRRTFQCPPSPDNSARPPPGRRRSTLSTLPPDVHRACPTRPGVSRRCRQCG